MVRRSEEQKSLEGGAAAFVSGPFGLPGQDGVRVRVRGSVESTPVPATRRPSQILRTTWWDRSTESHTLGAMSR